MYKTARAALVCAAAFLLTVVNAASAETLSVETIGPGQVRHVQVNPDGSARIHIGGHDVCSKTTLLLPSDHVARKALLSLALAAKATSYGSVLQAEVSGCSNGHPIVSGLTWIRSE